MASPALAQVIGRHPLHQAPPTPPAISIRSVSWREASSQFYAPGTRLFLQGARPHGVYLLDQGLVKLTRAEPNGRELLAALRPSGWPLGAASIITGRPSPVTAMALTECHLQLIPAEDFLYLIHNDAEFAWYIQQTHSRDIHEQTAQLSQLGCLSARARLEYLLRVFIAAQEPNPARQEIRFQFPITQYEVAEMIAVSREHLCRLLAQMQKEGVIRKYKGWLIVSQDWVGQMDSADVI